MGKVGRPATGRAARYSRSFNAAQMAWAREVFGKLLNGGDVRDLLQRKECGGVVKAFVVREKAEPEAAQ